MAAIAEDKFYGEYQPQINHIERFKQDSSIEDCDVAPFGGYMYETYGEELEHILKLIKEGKFKNIWTIVDDENGDLVIVAGYHLVNRFGYIVTEKEWDEEDAYVDEEY